MPSWSTGEEAAKARQLVEEAADRFAAWRRAVQVEPTIAALRSRAEQVRAEELQRFSAKLDGLDDRQREAVEAVTRGIINTLLHEPSVRLKTLAEARGDDAYADALRDLFGLPDTPDHPDH